MVAISANTVVLPVIQNRLLARSGSFLRIDVHRVAHQHRELFLDLLGILDDEVQHPTPRARAYSLAGMACVWTALTLWASTRMARFFSSGRSCST